MYTTSDILGLNRNNVKNYRGMIEFNAYESIRCSNPDPALNCNFSDRVAPNCFCLRL